jgi:hypothetical protein
MTRIVKSLLFGMSLIQGCTTLSAVQESSASLTHTYERRCGLSLLMEPVDVVPYRLPEERVARMRSQFSTAAFETASALGVLPSLDRLLELEAEIDPAGEGPALPYVRERLHLTDRITLGILDVSSAVVESYCEEGRATLLADHLQKVQDERMGVYTVFALVGSGVATIVSGGIALASTSTGTQNAANIATIVAGASELIFGSTALGSTATAEFRHERNLLKDIWTGENTAFAPPVWSFLNTRLTDDPAQGTLREHLIVRWRQEGRLGKAGSEMERRRIQLFFGDGGIYTIDELRERAAMLDLLETNISLMHQGLNRLIRELLKRDRL